MTLIVTEISSLGIVMAADSAVTQQITLDGRQYWQVLTGAVKLNYVPRLKAGISVWGQAVSPDIPSDVWLTDFIQRHSDVDSMEAFAELLEGELRRCLGRRAGSEATVGFHLAGFVDTPVGRLPDFWHIHDGPSQSFPAIDPTLFNANHDQPPHQYPVDEYFYTHNGDYRFYSGFLRTITALLKKAEARLGMPVPRTLEQRAALLRWQIRAVSDLYRISSATRPHIGGQISSLAISTDGPQELQWE